MNGSQVAVVRPSWRHGFSSILLGLCCYIDPRDDASSGGRDATVLEKLLRSPIWGRVPLSPAQVLVIVAIFFDGLDGAAARALRVEGPFGEMLDSLCDVIGFVVAPAFLAYQADLRSYDLVGPAVMFAFIACGAIRLARFPLIKAKAYFLGLPTPASGATLGMLSLYAGELPEGLLVVATGGLAILMVTLIRFPKFNTTLRFLPPPMRWVFVLVVVPSLIVFQPKALLGLMCLYLLSGPAIELRLQRGGPGA